MHLLDTCALSELVAKRPNPRVVEAILSLPANEWFFSAITVGEIRRGIEEMEGGDRRSHLENWFREHVCGIYLDRIIAFDVAEATVWGMLVGNFRRKRFPMPVNDSLIAATALTHNLTVMTRNEADFIRAGVKIFNPWK